jgi:hypothetical protein
MIVTVTASDWSTHFNVNLTTTIDSLMTKIEEIRGTPKHTQQLVCSGRLLDPRETFGHYHIPPQATLKLLTTGKITYQYYTKM